ncbi:hypothetical protein [Pseudonocardia sp. HH130630-07]|uniref:hypothetical protein n=1 Tax=Pseudonocardia sp. HH130630-07 TaxID=1690815 RepID=UPI000814EF42|nr:hypothetical protein [Pseudonocardia sp. HH130630-07]ANY07484.1 hypothetical protein AFB00_15630 [Pseudonocardia sp. HH130630-07]
MPKLKIPALGRRSLFSGWPLVGVIAIGLTLVALLYGSATDEFGGGCSVTVQASEVTVRATPSASGQPLETLLQGEEVSAEAIVDTGFRKLAGGDRWVPSSAVAATAGSVC